MSNLPFRVSNVLMNNLVRSSVELYSSYRSSERLYNQPNYLKVIETLQDKSLISFRNVNITSSIKQLQPLRIISFFSHPLVRVSMYYIPFGQIMTIHNHPEMCVISSVIKGSMEGKFYRQLKKQAEKRQETESELLLCEKKT